MKKKVLYISRSHVDESPVGIRYNNFKKYLEMNTDLTVLNLTNDSFLYSRKNKFHKVINRFIKKLPLLPDSDILIIWKYKKAIKRILNQNNYNSIIIGILPISFLYLSKFIKKVNKKLKVIVDMSDPISANISFNSLSKMKQNFLLNLEKNYLKYVDTLIVLNKDIKNYYDKKYEIDTIEVIEQGIDPNCMNLPKTILSKKVKQINLIYAGHLFKNGREPYELYKAIKMSNHNIKLRIFGQFKNCFYPPKEDKFCFGGRISRDNLQQEYQKANIIVFIDNKNSIQVPGKTLEVLALNKPILFIYFNDSSPTLKYVKNYPGVFFAKNNSQDILAALNSIILNNIYFFERNIKKFYWNNLLCKLNKHI
jgi:hypothetical protein